MKYLNKTIIAIAAIAMSVSMTSCDDFLDVRSENTAKEDDLFKSYKGFKDALTGAYMLMASESVYGLNNMTQIDALTNLWWCTSSHEDYNPLLYQLQQHNYSEDVVKDAFSSYYNALFKAVAQANVVEKHCEDADGVVDPTPLAIIEGEAVAIRAYCQLDVLRLFGQMPQGGSKQVKLPYSFCTGVSEMPSYYSFDEYCKLLEADLDKALTLLKDNDPSCKYPYSDMANGMDDTDPLSGVEDEFFYHRQMRLNYHAVKALKCRFLLYAGRTSEAHALALELINSTSADGRPVVSLSGQKDLEAGFHGTPTECLFMLQKFDLLKKANAVLFGYHTSETEVRYDTHYVLTKANYEKLYLSQGAISGSNNRRLYLWSEGLYAGQRNYMATLKYWYDESKIKGNTNSAAYNSRPVMFKAQIIPMLRLSEVYLIALETATSIDEANSLYKDYMLGCGIPGSACPVFDSLDAVKEEIPNEYQREFVAEGQAFYTYKRLGMSKTMFGTSEMGDDQYIVPLPSTEYDPAL